MSCRTGSTASGITACWPTRPARPTSPESAPCSASSSLNSPLCQNHKPRSHHSPCANHVPAAAAQCTSSKSSGAGKSRHHEHRQGSRPHDKSPVTRHGNPPAAIRRLGPNSLCLLTSSVARSGNDTETHSFVGILSRACERIGHHAHLQPYP